MRALSASRAWLVGLAAFVAFTAVVPSGEWVFDDHVLIERNEDLRRDDIWWSAFTRDYYATSAAPGVSGYYRPIAVLCNAFDVHVGRAHPEFAHLTNLVLHVSTALVVPLALGALGVPGTAAWITAAAFALHPLHAESVAFVSGRVDVLATLFVLLALVSAASVRQWAWLGFGVSSVLAFLSKEIAVVLPALVVLVWWRRGQRLRLEWPKLAALAAAIAIAVGLRAAALAGELLPTTAHASRDGMGLLPLQTLVFACTSLFAPVLRLAIEPDPQQLGWLRPAVGVLVAIALWVGALRLQPRSACGRVAIAGFVSLLPVLNWVPQETRLSERLLYLASAFLLTPVGVLGAWAWDRSASARRAWIVLALLIGSGLMVISTWRARLWRHDLSVWQQAVREEPDRAAFWDRLGLAYTERRDYAPAEVAAQRAVELDPGNFNAWYNLGVLREAKRDPHSAVAAFRRAVELQPKNTSAHVHLGRLLASARDLEGAYAEFQAALALEPDHFDALRMAGMLALRIEEFEAAERYLEAARRLEPENRSILQALEKLRQRRQ
ncbi:MAG TPA: tetratricopeptide repeat protein [Candidatus Krumholzibacteria bacterium]|nr:tetratricopeptide repeat protein [Candidatus Krumholzibacteria bacterium]